MPLMWAVNAWSPGVVVGEMQKEYRIPLSPRGRTSSSTSKLTRAALGEKTPLNGYEDAINVKVRPTPCFVYPLVLSGGK